MRAGLLLAEQRLHLGSWKSLSNKLCLRRKGKR